MKRVILNYDEATGAISDKNGQWLAYTNNLQCDDFVEPAPAGALSDDIAKILAVALHSNAAERFIGK